MPELTAEDTIRIILSNLNLVVPVVAALLVIIIAIIVICILRSKGNHHKGIYKNDPTNFDFFLFSLSRFLFIWSIIISNSRLTFVFLLCLSVQNKNNYYFVELINIKNCLLNVKWLLYVHNNVFRKCDYEFRKFEHNFRSNENDF